VIKKLATWGMFVALAFAALAVVMVWIGMSPAPITGRPLADWPACVGSDEASYLPPTQFSLCHVVVTTQSVARSEAQSTVVVQYPNQTVTSLDFSSSESDSRLVAGFHAGQESEIYQWKPLAAWPWGALAGAPVQVDAVRPAGGTLQVETKPGSDGHDGYTDPLVRWANSETLTGETFVTSPGVSLLWIVVFFVALVAAGLLGAVGTRRADVEAGSAAAVPASSFEARRVVAPVTGPVAPTTPKPSLDDLQEWAAAGGCHATDGCWVDAKDEECSHGFPTWLVQLGLA
jgi:hypothetical protein